ncbi:roadblock/LC7 domain-containing protein [Phaeacidiphilus oryzae]|jgi:hypothetical protein|uniref:hypothetical protein n=1 Tax=Phaeacidiphilus oryzae TaxID=348818 RepID=UPI000567BA85|nr:hypothetical protein [Phaeacidiphilus oryzae]
MPNLETALKDALAIDGAFGVALVDYNSGLALGSLGNSPDFDLNIAAAAITDVVRAKLRALEMLSLHQEALEDMLITLSGQYHVVRPMTAQSGQGIFLYLALDRARANLALARHQMKLIEQSLEL